MNLLPETSAAASFDRPSADNLCIKLAMAVPCNWPFISKGWRLLKETWSISCEGGSNIGFGTDVERRVAYQVCIFQGDTPIIRRVTFHTRQKGGAYPQTELGFPLALVNRENIFCLLPNQGSFILNLLLQLHLSMGAFNSNNGLLEN